MSGGKCSLDLVHDLIVLVHALSNGSEADARASETAALAAIAMRPSLTAPCSPTYMQNVTQRPCAQFEFPDFKQREYKTNACGAADPLCVLTGM